ncbi:MAG TPA: ribonuclease H-like domain-containing protein [Candidatus Limnocylindrales bacterium]|nr:ribonuclease H-like domain-containing protein [Candidatus Limnocylindrales bacterium]
MDISIASGRPAASGLLSRRLDRLRSSTVPAPSQARASTPDFSAALAQELGGQVERSAGGSIAVFESTFAGLGLDRARLAGLPYPVPDGHPLVCIDLETTGLATAAGTLAFLVGVGTWVGESMVVRQLVLPDHAGETALLDVLCSVVPADAWLVTYNGRCFDWPLLVARYRLHRRAAPVHAGHLDLLPVARQLWKHRLEGARLAIVEREICGVMRDDDLPGHLIPERYFTYLRSRRAELLRPILEHNRQDIVSLGQMLGRLVAGFGSPEAWPATHPGDVFGLARAFARQGRHPEALNAVEAALGADAWSLGVTGGAGLHRRLSAERARLLARVGRRDEAYRAWSEIALRGGPGAGLAWLAVARYREHTLRDIAGALDACQQAASVAERARAWGNPLFVVERDLARRLPRLRRVAFRRRPFRPTNAANRDVSRAA